MEALITSYGLEFKSFNDLLIKHRAIIAGSSVLSVYLKEQSSPDQRFNNTFVANDIDIWIPCNKSLNTFLPIYKDLFKYFAKYGYDDEEINKKEVTNETTKYTNLPTGRMSITKVLEFYNSEDKRIQFIFIDMNPIHFIKTTFDLSICMTWYEPKTQTISTLDEQYTKEMKMYINYDKELKDLHPKNQARVEKYTSRGFTLIPKPLPILKERDQRVFTKEFKIEASDVILLGEVNICEYLKESRKNIILKVARSYYAYNRDELIKELNKFRTRNYTLTPVKQAILDTKIELFKYDDYSIYEIKITSVKTSDNKHILHDVRPMSVKKFESFYNENGVKEGLVKRFHSNGILKSETHYSEGIKNGIKKKYNTVGNLIEEIPYVNNKIQGVKKLYVDGKLYKISEYLNNKLNGKTTIYYPTEESKIKIKCEYLDDKLNGEYVEYHIKGNILTKLKYENGSPKLPSV